MIRFISIVLILVAVGSGFYIWRFQNSRGLSLELEAAENILVGTPFDLKINFSNRSGTVLEEVVLTLTLPDGVALVGSLPDKTVDIKSLGNVGIDSLIQENYKVVIWDGGEGQKVFRANVNYSPASLRARFEKAAALALEVSSSGMIVEMVAPEKVTSGEEFAIDLSYRNLSELDFSDLELKLEYPPTFLFGNASLKPDSGNNRWLLGDLRKNSEGKISIKGSIAGLEGETLEFKSEVTTRILGQSYRVSQASVKTLLAGSPLVVGAEVNSAPNYAAKSGETLNYRVSYINTSEIPLRDVVIQAQLLGELFDTGTIQTQGSFRAIDNTIIWNPKNTSTLSLLEPGSAGIVTFSIKVKENYLIRRFSDKHFKLQVNLEAESPTILPNSTANVKSKAQLVTKVNGSLQLDAKAYFRDANSGILNKGPFPPKVGESTNFTIHWLVKNFGNDISGIEVRVALGDNVKMVGGARSNAGSVPAYDDAVREVVWVIDKLQANQGVVSAPIEGIFQIEAQPPPISVGKYLPLVQESRIKAHDDFTGQELIGSDGSITTALPDDLTAGQQGGVVQP